MRRFPASILGLGLAFCWVFGCLLTGLASGIASAQSPPDAVATLDFNPIINAGDEAEVDLWVDLNWVLDAPVAVDWVVQLEGSPTDLVSSSRILRIHNLCASDESTGSYRLAENGQQVEFVVRQPLERGGMRLHLSGSLDTQLVCWQRQTIDGVSQANGLVRISFRELVTAKQTIEPRHESLVSDSPADTSVDVGHTSDSIRWTLKRSQSDELRMTPERSMIDVIVGEPVKVEFKINRLVEAANQTLRMRQQFRRLRDGMIIHEDVRTIALDLEGSCEDVPQAECSPTEPGIYELVTTLERIDDALWSRLRRYRETISERRVAIVAVERDRSQATPESPRTNWRTLATLKPSESRTWTLSRLAPNTADMLLAAIQTRREAPLPERQHAGEPVFFLAPHTHCEFSLPVDQLGKPHLVTLRYPTGKETRFRVELFRADQPQQLTSSFSFADSNVSIDAGPWGVETFVWYPSSRDEILRVVNINSHEASQIQSVIVQAGPDRLADLSTSQDQPSSLRGQPTMLAYALSGFRWVDDLTPELPPDVSTAESHSSTPFVSPAAVHQLFVATQRLIDYVRIAGFNTVVLPANDGGRYWYETNELHRRCDHALDFPEAFVLVSSWLNDAGIRVIAQVTPGTTLTRVESMLRQATVNSQDILRSIGMDSMKTTYSVLDPTVREALSKLVVDLESSCRGRCDLAGLRVQGGPQSHLIPVRASEYVSERVMQAFAQSLRGFPGTIAQLDGWRRSEGRAEFEHWLQSQQGHFARQLKQQSTLPLLLGSWGIDPGQLHESNGGIPSGILPSISFQNASLGSLSQRSVSAEHLNSIPSWEAKTTPRVLSLDEIDTQPQSPTARLHDRLALDVARLVDRLHPNMIIIESSAHLGTLNGLVIDSLNALANVSVEALATTTASDPSSHPVRVYRCPTTRKILLMNLAPWTTEIDMVTHQATVWVDDSGADKLAWVSPESGATAVANQEPAKSVTLTLRAGETRLIRSQSDTASIVDWTSRPAGGDIGMNRIKLAVTTVVERLGTLVPDRDYEVLANGGFEQPASVGITGWLTAQHPSDAVRLDREASEGEFSVCLTTDGRNNARTWLVSETITSPSSGRLAIALALRAQLSEVKKPAAQPSSDDGAPERDVARLRIALEGTRRGEPVRFATDLEIPRDGRWYPRRSVLEVDGLDPQETTGLRLAIDSLTPGRIWIDDVHLFDWFPLERERNELQGQSFLAVQGLQRGSLAPAARLVRNDWARYLMSLEKPTSDAKNPDSAPVSREPGMAERLKSWIPRPLRF